MPKMMSLMTTTMGTAAKLCRLLPRNKKPPLDGLLLAKNSGQQLLKGRQQLLDIR